MNMMFNNENSNCINILSPEVREFFQSANAGLLAISEWILEKEGKVLKTIFEMHIGFPDLVT